MTTVFCVDTIVFNMHIDKELLSALTQVSVVVVICAVVFGVQWIFFRQSLIGQSFLKYIGIQGARRQFDRKFFIVWIAILIFSFVSTQLQWKLSDELRQMMMKDSSPYAAILKNSEGVSAIFLALIYCFVKASGSEEILFRGLIGKKLFSRFGFIRGNIFQALIFWLMHWGIFRLVTGEWISLIQLLAFITSFGLGLVLGYVNFRKSGESIAPSWVLHGSANFMTFLCLMFLWKADL